MQIICIAGDRAPSDVQFHTVHVHSCRTLLYKEQLYSCEDVLMYEESALAFNTYLLSTVPSSKVLMSAWKK